ncbi:Myosin-2 essential light chain [Stylophora pistillata]|uniref:Myosin-2 essential light chain n=2 Tax=Stylophora pistillata TaxID=50429 RepID=A0A2B4STA2_STYPI|nr:Myosin-2 essential light chain [Stylophora pistillata]
MKRKIAVSYRTEKRDGLFVAVGTWTRKQPRDNLVALLRILRKSFRNAMTDLTEEQILEFKDAFSLFDNVGDGKVDKSQVPGLLRSVGLNPLKQDLDKVKENLKSMKEKRVAFEEFLPIYVTLAKKQVGSEEEFIGALKMFDRDGNGYISSAELRRMLTALGDKLTEAQAEHIVGMFETKGMIDYEKLVQEVLSN